jgi:hypothetical protein
MALTTVLLVFGGCSDDNGGSTKDAIQLQDQKVTPQKDTGIPDLPPLADLSDLGSNDCDFEWQNAISPHQKVSTGAVSTSDIAGGVKETLVDASAGGVSEAIKNPFVYISLKDGSKVSIDDFAARKDSTWDLAIRRTTIRVNGGDSGPGKGAVAVLVNKTLDQVTAVPDAKAFLTDDFLDENCVIQYNDAQYIKTAFGGQSGRWYDFDTTNMKVKVRPDAYVIKTAAGDHVKLVIKSYYNAKGEGANYTLHWTPIK